MNGIEGLLCANGFVLNALRLTVRRKSRNKESAAERRDTHKVASCQQTLAQNSVPALLSKLIKVLSELKKIAREGESIRKGGEGFAGRCSAAATFRKLTQEGTYKQLEEVRTLQLSSA